MSDSLSEVRHRLAIASRILAHEGVLDAFGHVSARHPGNPDRYLLPRARSPELVEPADLLEFDLDSNPVNETTAQLFSERVIHGEIYKARPDVVAVAHHHGSAILPFCISGEPLVPVFHLGAAVGATVPMWDQRDEFGDTNLLVVKPEEGASLARALGDHAMVLMWRHGATVVGGTLQEAVFRSIYSCRNAEYQSAAKLAGPIGGRGALSAGEIELAGRIYNQPNVVGRVWEYWVSRLAKAGELPPEPAAPAVARGRPSRAKPRPATRKAKPAAQRRTPAKRGRKTKGRTR